jgi:phosphoglycolate phosphatase
MTALPQRTTVLFDLDGTLTDPYVGISRSFAHAMRELGRPLPDGYDYRPSIGPPMRIAFSLLCGDDENEITRGIAIYRERYATIGLYENAVYDGVPAMLERAAASFRLLVCTSKPYEFANRILAHFGLAGAFDAVYGAEFDGTRSNKAELMAWLLEREGLAPEAAIMIGDRSHDILAARANGVAHAAAAWGYGTPDELRAAGCTHAFAHPDDVTLAALRGLTERA